MLWFTVQLAILLLAAYFAGAMLGCMMRRTFFPRTLRSDAPQRVTGTAPAPSAGPTRFERALTGASATGAPAASIPAATAPVAKAPAAAAPAVNAAVSAAVTAVAAAARAQQQPAGILPAAMGSSGLATVSAPTAPRPASVAPAAAPAPAPVAVAAGAASAPQDLTRIRAIDDAMQKALNGLGVKSFADIAGWKPNDVARVAGAMKIPGRIEQENWIEQAQILAKGGETYYSRRKLKGEQPTSRPTPDEGDRITVRVPAATRPAAAPAAAPSTAAQVASAVQAAQTVVAAAPAAAPASAPAAAATVASAAAAASVKIAAPAAAAPTAAGRPIGMARDDLQRIASINVEVERLLNVQGVTRYAQIAGWSPGDTSRFDRLLGFEGRIARENWIEQAQILAKGSDTAYARDHARRTSEAARPAATADRAAAREDLSTLRSVRSEAYRGPDAAAAPGRPGDDLKRIRGVGVLIEKKLNGLGVTRYDQVANWTQSDIERFSEKLDFNGRIERENWVEQARILSAGGQTEFSQRVDRGEVETSRAKT